MVQATFDLATAILTAGGLSFLGLGIQPPTPEWGSMLAQGRRYMRVAPHLIALPGLALAVLILGVNLLGDALRQAYDPRFQGRD
jgi:peptide/nickel transport system permease protein